MGVVDRSHVEPRLEARPHPDAESLRAALEALAMEIRGVDEKQRHQVGLRLGRAGNGLRHKTGAAPFQGPCRLQDDLGDRRLGLAEEEVVGNGKTEPGDIPFETGHEIGRCHAMPRSLIRVDDRRLDPGDIGDAPPDRPHDVMGRTDRKHAGRGDAAAGRPEAGRPGQGGGHADRGTGIAAERTDSQPGRDRDGRPAAGAAGDSPGIPRVPASAEEGVLGRSAIGEFVEVGLADEHRAGGPEPGHDFGIALRDPVGEEARPAGARDARDVDAVLDGDRHAVKKAQGPALARRGIRGPRGFACRLGGHCDESMEERIEFLDALEAGLGSRDR